MPSRVNLLNHYSIFCGAFYFSDYNASEAFAPWQTRLNDAQAFFDRLGKTYQPHFIYQIFDESGKGVKKHETRSDVINKQEFIGLNGTQYQINWIDRYLFRQGLGLFALHVSPLEDPSYTDCHKLITSLREADSTISAAGTTMRLVDFLYEKVGEGITLKSGWDRNMDRLKHYTNINDNSVESFDKDHDDLLFELAHALPLGSVSTVGSQSPSREYYENVFFENSLSPYANWKALALLDSFTRISTTFPDERRNWEEEFFQIYMYCLLGKYFISTVFNKCNEPDLKKNQFAKLKESFLSFASQYATSNVSSKFLSNAIHEKMVTGLCIDGDLADLARKINWLSELDKRENIVQPNSNVKLKGSQLIPGFSHDIFISFQPHANNAGWVSDFISAFTNEIGTVFKEKLSIHFHYEELSQDDQPLNVNAVVFIPILSHTYINIESEVWKTEIMEFARRARSTDPGLSITVKDGNVANRIFPVVIHVLDEEDFATYKKMLGIDIRGVDFIYSEPGINRPLEPDDDPKQNLKKTSYRNQINKLANAVKDLMKAMKASKITS